MHKFCKCGGSILTLGQMATDQLCDRCKDEQLKEVQNDVSNIEDSKGSSGTGIGVSS